jgi:UDP:flavonoid glycosyltransferase YjiC (YdhE family)
LNSGRNINIAQKTIRVLVVPLDWGLGHATRCIPIIKRLKEYGVEVIIAGEGKSLEILVNLLPGTVFFPLKGYRVNYASRHLFFLPHLLSQFFKINAAIKHEHRWLDHFITEHQIDAVISDNRFGLWTNKKPSVFITHQLHIQTGNTILNRVAEKINYSFIKKFSECWIMDDEKNRLAGLLSDPRNGLSFPANFLGLSSRFSYRHVARKEMVLFLLSGPEPSRTRFEEKILKEIPKIPCPVFLVRGLPAEKNKLSQNFLNLTVYNHADPDMLSELIASAGIIVCRPGYSTLMDLCALRRHAVVVPTPGQKEQEYLAEFNHEKKLFLHLPEKTFSWKNIRERYAAFSFSENWPEVGINEDLIKAFLHSLMI